MSVFIEILKCILCCEEEHFSDSDDERESPFCDTLITFIRRNSTRSHNYSQDSTNSFSINSTTTFFPSQNSTNYNSFQPTYSYIPPPSSTKPPQSSSKLLQTSSTPYPSLPKRPPSTSKPSPSPIAPSSSSKPSPSIPKPTTSSSKPTPSPIAPSSSSKPSPSIPKPTTSSSKPSPSIPKPTASSSKPSPSIPKSTTSSSKPSPSIPKPTAPSSKPSPLSPIAPVSLKPTLSHAPSHLIYQQTKTNDVWVQENTSPLYMIPKDMEYLIKKGIVPEVLKKPLSPSTYQNYFAALLYAEDYYIEKWNDFQLLNVTLEVRDDVIYKRSGKNTHLDERHEKNFVAFEIDSVPERRPFLLSRDFVFARPVDSKEKRFQGIIYRVVKSSLVFVEFEEDFHYQHYPEDKYDVSFSFNRVCLKRAHQAVATASDPLFHDFIFPARVSRKRMPTSPPLPSPNHKFDLNQNSAVCRILSFQGLPPYLVEGPKSISNSEKLSKTGMVVREAVLQIYRRVPGSRILICAPINSTCDVLMRSLMKEIPGPNMFRANAAFREIDGVHSDILASSLYDEECFTCHSLPHLQKFRVILSTFVSSFRLMNEGITAGHFSHIFLVDASSATEPETMIALANLANEKTAVIVTGAPRNHSGWVRSDIARHNGLRKSYFERLRNSKPYVDLNPMFIAQLDDVKKESSDTYAIRSFSYNFD